MNLFNWLIDSLASSETIDLDFIQTDLKDIPISDTEFWEAAKFDSDPGTEHMSDDPRVGMRQG